jgi:putative peptidoglycan lipid II flippase
MLPKMVAHPVEPMTFLFFTRVATRLEEGSVTAVSFARNFQSVPVSLVGVAFALAVFPALSTAYATGDRPAFVRLFGRNLATIAVITTASAAVLAVVGELAIRVLLGGGAFDARDVGLTALVLGAFAVSIPFESVSHLLSRAIYATRHTLLQVLSSLAGLAVTVPVTLLLVDGIGVVAIPVGFAAGQAAKVALLGLSLGLRLRAFPPPLAGAGVAAAE